MAEKCGCGCMCTWLSGFFAMPAIGHLIRIIAKWDVTWQGSPVTMQTSWTVLVITGILSIVFGYIAHKKNKETGTTNSACC